MGLEGEHLVKTLEVYCLMKVIMGNEPYPVVMRVRRKSPNWTAYLPLFSPVLGREQHMSQSTSVPRLGKHPQEEDAPGEIQQHRGGFKGFIPSEAEE